MAENSNLSKHVQTVVTACATGFLGWLAFSVQENNTKLAVIQEKVSNLESRLGYVALDPARQIPVPDQRIPVEVHALPANYAEPKITRK